MQKINNMSSREIKEAEIIFLLLKKFSTLRSKENNDFFYAVKGISISCTKGYPIKIEGTRMRNQKKLRKYIEQKISNNSFLPSAQTKAELFKKSSWDLEIIPNHSYKTISSDQRNFLIEAKGGMIEDKNLGNYIIRAFGQALISHATKLIKNTNICLAFPWN